MFVSLSVLSSLSSSSSLLWLLLLRVVAMKGREGPLEGNEELYWRNNRVLLKNKKLNSTSRKDQLLYLYTPPLEKQWTTDDASTRLPLLIA